LRVITILATPARVHAGRLQMTVFDGADPYLLPGSGMTSERMRLKSADPSRDGRSYRTRRTLCRFCGGASPANCRSRIVPGGYRGLYRVCRRARHAALVASAVPIVLKGCCLCGRRLLRSVDAKLIHALGNCGDVDSGAFRAIAGGADMA
jgi:hypothetical protein